MHSFLRAQRHVLFRALFLSPLLLITASCSRGDRVRSGLDQASRHFQAGRYEQAEIEYKNVLQQDANNGDAISQLGLIYHEQGRDGRAAAFLLRARELQPDNLAVRLKLGLAHLRAGGLKQAREEAVFVLQHQPGNEHAPLLLVEASADAAERADALQLLLALPAPAVTAAPALVARGNIALREQRLAEAEPLFRQALASDPKSVSAHGALAVVHWSRGELASADAAFKRAAELSPARSLPRLHYAQFKLKNGELAEAKQLLEALTQETPDYLPGWIWLAEIANAEKKPEVADELLSRALALDPLHAEALLLRARTHLARGETAKSVDEFERIRTLFPQSAVVGHQLSLAYAANGDIGKALAQATQTLASAPGMIDAAVTLTELHLRQRDFAAAAKAIAPIVEQRPEFAGARLLLAEAQRGQGNYAAAAEAYAVLEKQRPQEAQLAFAHGTVLLQGKDLVAARAKFERAIALQPGHLGAVERLIDLDLREKKPAAARARIASELERHPGSGPLWALRARICLIEGDVAGAESALQTVLKIQPASAAAHFQLAQLYVRSNQTDKAIAKLQTAAAEKTALPGPTLILAVLLHERKDYAGAREAYEKVLALDPRNTPALNNLAYLYAEHLGDADRAVALAQRARTLAPEDSGTADTLGWALTKKKQYTEALPLLQASATELPDNADVQYHLGVARYQLGQEAAAAAALKRALELKADFTHADDARTRLALLAIDADRPPADSHATLERRIADHPDDSPAQYRLGSIARHAGETKEALGRYRAVLAANPRHAGALLNTARLQAATGEVAAALETAKTARAAAPDDAVVAHGVAQIAHLAGDHRWAASLLQQVTRARPDDAEIRFDLAETEYCLGRVSEAEACLKQALALDAKFSRAAQARTFLELISLTADPAQAAAGSARVAEALRLHPEWAPALFATAVMAEHRSGIGAARKPYEKLLERFPDFAPAQRNLAVLYANAGIENARAAVLAGKARSSFPNDRALARAAGIIAYRQGEFTRAISLLQPWAAGNEADAELWYYLGMAQCQSNKRADGQESLTRALELGLHEPLAREAKKNLVATGG